MKKEESETDRIKTTCVCEGCGCVRGVKGHIAHQKEKTVGKPAEHREKVKTTKVRDREARRKTETSS